jgi:hypothetical protein
MPTIIPIKKIDMELKTLSGLANHSLNSFISILENVSITHRARQKRSPRSGVLVVSCFMLVNTLVVCPDVSGKRQLVSVKYHGAVVAANKFHIKALHRTVLVFDSFNFFETFFTFNNTNITDTMVGNL